MQKIFFKKLLVFSTLIVVEHLYPSLIFSQWTYNTAVNTPVCTSINNQKDYSLSSDTKGGVFVVWNDKRNNILKSDIYAQRINSFGYTMWTSQGIGVCTTPADQANPSTTEDGNGGVIIAWDDSTNGDRDIYAQKLDSLGIPQWSLNGVPVVVKANKQKNVKIISDGAGGAIAVWEDSLAGYWDIYAQRISSTGTAMWTIGGVPVCTAVLNQKSPRLIPDGAGGALIVWQDKRNIVDYDIFAQHLNSSGTALWANNGVSICVIFDKQIEPKIVPDGTGGAIIAWVDKRGGVSNDIFAQRINSAGIVQWTTNGKPICVADSGQTSLDITSDNISGAIITWRDKRSIYFHDIYAQKINLDGTIAWTFNGVPIVTGGLTQTGANICGDGSGGAIITWQDSTIGNWDVKSQRINSAGSTLWNYGGNVVSNAPNFQTNPKNISDGNGGCIYVWQDQRNGIDDDIYAQHLSPDGLAGIFEGNLPESNNIFLFPNPICETAAIKCSDKNIDISSSIGEIYDVSGKIIYTFNIDKADYKMNVKNLANGIYFLKIIDNSKTLSIIKFVVKK
jgi:predicted lipoprotein with Yx(FWY)xxD motif